LGDALGDATGDALICFLTIVFLLTNVYQTNRFVHI
jgi:hypothetical protein